MYYNTIHYNYPFFNNYFKMYSYNIKKSSFFIIILIVSVTCFKKLSIINQNIQNSNFLQKIG
jgi:hypothetical protein